MTLSGFPWNSSDAAGFADWLTYFQTWEPAHDSVPDATVNDFSCYNPLSMQARQLGPSCFRSPHHIYRHLWPPAANATAVAVQRLGSFAFVGIMDLYDASYCLLTHRLGGVQPAGCFDPAVPVTETHIRHGDASRPFVRADLVDETVWRLADAVTRADQELFVAGVGRLLHELQAYQASPGVRSLSPHLLNLTALEAALVPLTYRPELREARGAVLAAAAALRESMAARAGEWALQARPRLR
jgi:hypothetical protein